MKEQSQNSDCIFCKLANGEIPTNWIYEDAEFKVILDNSPASKGHALILPKEHYANIYEMDEELLGRAAQLAQRIIRHETKVLGCDGYNLLQNNGETAGQTIFHFHMHLIPRYQTEENAGLLQWKHQEYSQQELVELSQQMLLSTED